MAHELSSHHCCSSKGELYGAGAQDDIVLQTFKQQQEAYRQLLEGMKVGGSVSHMLACPAVTHAM